MAEKSFFDSMVNFGMPDLKLDYGTDIANPSSSYSNFQNGFPGFSPTTATGFGGTLADMSAMNSAIPAAPASPSWGSRLGGFMKDTGIIGSTDSFGNKTEGWGSTAIGAGNLFLNMANYGKMKEVADAQMALNQTNLNNQVKTTSAAQMAHANRVYEDAKANGYSAQTPEEYMKQYGVTA